VITSVSTSTFVCSVHVVFAMFAGRWAKAVPVISEVIAATVSVTVLSDFMMMLLVELGS
jgi:hypothetical protein